MQFKDNIQTVKNQEVLLDMPAAATKSRPWRPKKVRSLLLADSYDRLGEKKRAARVRFCGSQLTFAVDASGRKTLHDADFCRERLCPLCAWRRSLKCFHEVSHVMDIALKDYPFLPLFLTLTLRNCSADNLSDTLDKIFDGWHRLVCNDRMKRIIKGWFRGLEVTYNQETNTYHPHIHAIIMVDRQYLTGPDYINHAEWVAIWRRVTQVDYNPSVRIMKVRGGNDHKALAEVAKYTCKDTDYLTNDKTLTDTLVKVLSNALRGRRLYAYGGTLKKIARELGTTNPDEGDLVHIEDDTIRDDVGTMLVTYRWSMGIANYLKDEK